MTTRVPTWVLLLCAVTGCSLVGCASGRGRDLRPTDVELSPAAYCEVLSADGLLDWSGNAATLCPGGVDPDAFEGDPLAADNCTVYTVDSNGGMVPTGITGARAAQALSDGRFVVWGWDGRLTIDENGRATEVAPVALDPWVDPVSGKIAFIAPTAGATALEPGDDREVMLYDIPSGASMSLIVDGTASAPVPIPGTGDVLYVSSASGVASIIRVTPTETLTLTNADANSVEQEFVPVYGRQLLFLDGGDSLVFTAEYETDVLWRLNLRTGEAEELGPGRYPALGRDGSVLAGGNTGSDACASHYLDGVTP